MFVFFHIYIIKLVVDVGYKTFDENSFNPSGGEEQKIALIRALYKNTPIIILDEPTASLDPKAEADIYDDFNHMTEGKSVIYVSHRMSSSRFCDRILVLDEGQIIEDGSHDELMKHTDGRYYTMFSKQAEEYNKECSNELTI